MRKLSADAEFLKSSFMAQYMNFSGTSDPFFLAAAAPKKGVLPEQPTVVLSVDEKLLVRLRAG